MNRCSFACLSTAILIILSLSSANASIIYVKKTGNDDNNGLAWNAAKATIAGALSTASSGTEIWVAAGTYTGEIDLVDGVDLYGGFTGSEKSRAQRNWRSNQTILDGDNTADCMIYANGLVTSGARVDGFTICNCGGLIGIGMYCVNSDVTVANCTITGNSEGGICCCDGGAYQIFNNVISANETTIDGAGIWVDSAQVDIRNNLIVGNSAFDTSYGANGGGLYFWGVSGTVSNNTIVGNSANGEGGALYADHSSLQIANNIITSNNSGIYQAEDSSLVLASNCVYGNSGYSYLNSKGGQPVHATDISVDPLFVNTAGGNYHLKPGSLCRNAGNNAYVSSGDKDMDNRGRIERAHVDIGADEYRSVRFDINGDGIDGLIGLSGSRIWYSANKTGWTQIPGELVLMTTGDFDGNGYEDVAGINGAGEICRTLDKGISWTKINGVLSSITNGDFTGDGKDDIIGINPKGEIWCCQSPAGIWRKVSGTPASIFTANINGDKYDDLIAITSSGALSYTLNARAGTSATWSSIQSKLVKLAIGDINGDRKDDIACLNANGEVYFTTSLSGWSKVSGKLASICCGDVNGDGKDDLIGRSSANKIYYCTNPSAGTSAIWTPMPGYLSSVAVGDFNNDGTDDIAGLNSSGLVYYSTNKTSWINIPGTFDFLFSAR